MQLLWLLVGMLLLAMFLLLQIRVDPWKIYVLVGCIIVVDIVVLGLWQGIDPMYRKLDLFVLEKPHNTDMDIMIQPQLEHCDSVHNNIWLGKLIKNCFIMTEK